MAGCWVWSDGGRVCFSGGIRLVWKKDGEMGPTRARVPCGTLVDSLWILEKGACGDVFVAVILCELRILTGVCRTVKMLEFV